MLLCIGLVGAPARAADVDALRIRSSLARNAQEQQFVRQQIQLTQALLRSEESKILVMQSYIRLPSASRSDPLRREADAPAAGVRPSETELDVLGARYRDLEQQRRGLVQGLSVRVHQRDQD